MSYVKKEEIKGNDVKKGQEIDGYPYKSSGATVFLWRKFAIFITVNGVFHKKKQILMKGIWSTFIFVRVSKRLQKKT